MLGVLLELIGLLLIAAVLWIAWPPAVLAFVGVLLVAAVEVRGRR